MQFPLGEPVDLGKESTVGVPERIRETETKDESTGDSESSHQGEQPEPSGFTADTPHVEDSVGQEFGRSLTELVSEIKEHDSFGSFRSSVPGTEGP